ncbi:MAG: FkbM family methyltransferase [Candidatus Omnitrophota bacterium]|nr:FkbM family methyltransferase [Candidatus Omnitrophota bacterium]
MASLASGFLLFNTGRLNFQAARFLGVTPELLQKTLSEGSVFLDVGANIGIFSLFASRLVGRSGKVLSIEASPSIYEYLKYNLELNRSKNCIPKNIAAFERDGDTVEFYEPDSNKFGMGSLSGCFVQHSPVKTLSIDSWIAGVGIKRITLMKVDVEGWEAAVFLGAEKLLSREDAPLIVFEFADWAESNSERYKVGRAQEILKSHGYRLWRLSDFLKKRKPLPAILKRGANMIVALKA